jgi:phosphoserine phosphatase
MNKGSIAIAGRYWNRFYRRLLWSHRASCTRTTRPLELAGQLDEALAAEWWNASLTLMRDARVNLREVERAFASRTSIRPGAVDLFDVCKRLGLPVAILSAGVGNIIELWCRHHELKPDVILATQLKLDGAGAIESWDKARVIHALNKRERGHDQLTAWRRERPDTILVGDSLSDAHMVEGDGQILRVRIYDPRPDETGGEVERRASLELFDWVLGGGSLVPLARLVEQIYGG